MPCIFSYLLIKTAKFNQFKPIAWVPMQYGQTEKAVLTPSSGKESGFLYFGNLSNVEGILTKRIEKKSMHREFEVTTCDIKMEVVTTCEDL
jgi:hypothetical protein